MNTTPRPRSEQREAAYLAFDTERDYQDDQRGNAKRHDGQPPMAPGEILLAAQKCMADAVLAWYAPDGGTKCLPHMRKVGALMTQALERFGAPHREPPQAG